MVLVCDERSNVGMYSASPPAFDVVHTFQLSRYLPETIYQFIVLREERRHRVSWEFTVRMHDSRNV